MKKLFLVYGLVTIFWLLSPLEGSSQVYHSTDDDVTVELINPTTKEVVHTLTGGMEKLLITPSGNFLRTVSFTVDPDHKIMNFTGPVRILEVKIYYDIDGEGVAEVITDTMAVLTRSGNLKFVFLVNGAGSRLPRGWDF
jgi:hypothetical protein